MVEDSYHRLQSIITILRIASKKKFRLVRLLLLLRYVSMRVVVEGIRVKEVTVE